MVRPRTLLVIQRTETPGAAPEAQYQFPRPRTLLVIQRTETEEKEERAQLLIGPRTLLVIQRTETSDDAAKAAGVSVRADVRGPSSLFRGLKLATPATIGTKPSAMGPRTLLVIQRTETWQVGDGNLGSTLRTVRGPSSLFRGLKLIAKLAQVAEPLAVVRGPSSLFRGLKPSSVRFLRTLPFLSADPPRYSED